MTCKAIREGDQLVCGRCGLQWDIDDPDRPQCLTDGEIVQIIPKPEPDHAVGAEAIKEIRESITPEKKERLHHDDK